MADVWLFLQRVALVMLNLNITIGCALAVLLLLRPLMRRLPAQPRALCWVDVCWLMPSFAGAPPCCPPCAGACRDCWPQGSPGPARSG